MLWDCSDGTTGHRSPADLTRPDSILLQVSYDKLRQRLLSHVSAAQLAAELLGEHTSKYLP